MKRYIDHADNSNLHQAPGHSLVWVESLITVPIQAARTEKDWGHEGNGGTMTRCVQVRGILRQERVTPSGAKEKHKKRAPWPCTLENEKCKAIQVHIPSMSLWDRSHGVSSWVTKAQNTYRSKWPSPHKIASSMPAVRDILCCSCGRQHDLINRHTTSSRNELQRCDFEAFHVMSVFVPKFLRTISMPLRFG